MADGFDVLNIKAAASHKSKLHNYRSHQTTMGLGQLSILMNEELLPSDDFQVRKFNIFSRMAPLVVPTYGKAELKTVTFFVPYYQIAKDADAWLSGQTVYRSFSTHQRRITYQELFNFFNNAVVSSNATGARVDFKYVNASGTTVSKVFTTKGKYYFKLLRQLGYNVPAEVDLRTNSYWSTNLKDKTFSAYPILAFFKAYSDWMYQSQNFNTAWLTQFLYSVKLGISVANYYDSTTGNITSGALLQSFQSLYILYQNDYFTSAWRYPNSPMGQDSTVSEIGFVHTDGANQKVTRSSSNNYLLSSQFSQTSLTQRSLDVLKRFDDWVRRNNYSGSRDVQQIYSRFGVKTDDFQSHYAYVIDRSTFPIQVGDVTSTTNNGDGAELGSYAGKGIATSEGHFQFDCSDYGLIFTIAWIAVTPVYADAVDRKVLKSEAFDYFNPEFDAVGPQAISIAEISECSKKATPSASNFKHSDSVFGFTERYNEYRLGARDQVTGDFTLYEGMDAWHFGRDLSAARNGGSLVAQSSDVVYMDQISSEFNRMFQNEDGSEDTFYLTAGFDVVAYRPLKSLNAVANLGDGDKVLPRNGNNIM